MFRPKRSGASRCVRSAAANDAVAAQADADHLLDIQDVSGRRWIDTELSGRMVVAEENASAALEVMSRFAIAPQWLAYLPPTMSPCGDQRARGLAGAAGGSLRLFPRSRRGGGRVRGEAHGFARRHRAVPNGRRREGAVRRGGRRHRRDLDPHRPRLLPRTDDDRSSARAAAFGDRSCGAVGRVSAPTGCSSTPRSCRGRPRRAA